MPADEGLCLIGCDVARVDVLPKTRGAAQYGIDTRLDGMIHGIGAARTGAEGQAGAGRRPGAKAVKGSSRPCPALRSTALSKHRDSTNRKRRRRLLRTGRTGAGEEL